MSNTLQELIMDDINRVAAELGSAIAETDIYREYKELSLSINAVDEKKELLDSYSELVGRIRQIVELGEEDVTDEMKAEYEELAVRINQEEDLIEFLGVQNRYLELMERVTATVTRFNEQS